MANERGGLDYPIIVRDQFSATTEKFREEIRLSSEVFRSFGQLGAQSKSVVGSLKDSAAAARELTKATKDLGEEQKTATALTSKVRDVNRDVDRAFLSAARSREIARVAEERGLDLSRRKVVVLSTEQAAIKKLTAERERLAVAERAAQIRAEATQGPQISTEEAAALKKVEDALRRKSVAARAAQIADERGIALGKAKIAALSFEEAAAAKLAAQERRLALATEVARQANEKLIGPRLAGGQFSSQGADVPALPQQGPTLSDTEAAALRRVTDALKKKAIAERAAQIADEQGVVIGKEKVAELSIEEAALARVNDQERKNAISTRATQIAQERQIGPRQANGLFSGSQPDAIIPAKELTLKERLLASFNKQLTETGTQGNNLLFTFRRLFGVLALFQAARLAFRSFVEIIKAGIEFNAEIQTSTLGVASLITAVADLRDQFGHTLEPARALPAALVLAKKQVALLRQEAFKTTAPFTELLEAFQTALSPGLTGGLKIDQVREFSVRISQAAQSIGLASNQLSEEIRSILSGTIQARTTRIATALGITNEDIRRAKEENKLFELLTDKFKAFEIAGEQAARGTFTGLFNLVKGVFQQALGEGSKGLFEDLIKLGNVLFDRVLTVKDALGNIVPNPRIVTVFREVFDVLKGLLGTAIQVAQSFGFGGAIAASKVFSDTLRILGELAIGVFAGITRTVLLATAAFDGLTRALGISNAEFASFLGSAASIVVPLIIVRNLLGSVGLGLLKLIGLLGQIPILFGKSGVSALALLGPILAIVGALTIVGTLFKSIAEDIFGVNLTIGETVDLLGNGLAGAFQSVITFVQLAIEEVRNFFARSLDAVSNFGEDMVRSTKLALATVQGDLDEVARLTTEQNDADLAADNELAKQKKEHAEKLNDIREKGALTQAALEKQIADTIGKAATRNAAPEGVTPPTAGFDFSEFLKTPDFIGPPAPEPNFDNPLSTAKSDINGLADELKGVEDEARKVRREFELTFGRPIVQGAAGQIEKTFQQAALEVTTKTREIDARVAATRAKIAELQAVKPVDDASAAQVQADLNSLLTDEEQLLAARNKLEKIATDTARTRAAIIAAEETPALVKENETLAQRVRAERAIAAATRGRATDSTIALLQARANLAATQQENAAKAEQLRLEISVSAQRARGATGDEKTALDKFVAGKQRQLTLEQDIAKSQEDQLAFLVQQADLVQNGTISQGVREGFIQLASELPTLFEVGVNTAKSAVDGFISLLGDAFASIFDPNSNFQLGDALGRLLLSLGQQLFQQVVQAAVAQFITAQLGLNTAGSTLSGAAIALAATVPGLFGAALVLQNAAIALSFAQLSSSAQLGFTSFFAKDGGLVPQGLAIGGPVRTARGRPRNIPASDTVPIWGTPGEFMQPLRAVRMYGTRTMEALRAGLIDPSAVASLVPGSAALATRTSPGAGFAEGGLISEQPRTVSSGSSSSDGGGVQKAVVVPSEQSFERLLGGGKGAMLKFLAENSGAVNSALKRK